MRIGLDKGKRCRWRTSMASFTFFVSAGRCRAHSFTDIYGTESIRNEIAQPPFCKNCSQQLCDRSPVARMHAPIAQCAGGHIEDRPSSLWTGYPWTSLRTTCSATYVRSARTCRVGIFSSTDINHGYRADPQSKAAHIASDATPMMRIDECGCGPFCQMSDMTAEPTTECFTDLRRFKGLSEQVWELHGNY